VNVELDPIGSASSTFPSMIADNVELGGEAPRGSVNPGSAGV